MLVGLIRMFLERVGIAHTTTERTAKERLERSLEGKTILGRGRRKLPGQDRRSFFATVAPYPELIRRASPKELAAVKENAALIGPFLERYTEYGGGFWTLKHLDAAFGNWLESGEKAPYTDEAVVQIAGAAFGEYCAEHLNMEWVFVEDADGGALAVMGIERNFKGFPHFSVRKRIPLGEYGFFEPVFESLNEQSKIAAPRQAGV